MKTILQQVVDFKQAFLSKTTAQQWENSSERERDDILSGCLSNEEDIEDEEADSLDEVMGKVISVRYAESDIPEDPMEVSFDEIVEMLDLAEQYARNWNFS
jgi:hypothetical protein